MERFLRSERLIGKKKLSILKKSHVCVVGLGAVGSFAVEALARSGIGSFLLIDFDRVNVTNINRQIFALDSTIGMKKSDLALKRVRDINPDCDLSSLDVFFNKDNFYYIEEYKPDLIVDAIDSIGPKLDLIENAYKSGIKIVSSMGAALKKDFTLIKKGNIFETKNCRLARQLRKGLRKRGVEGEIACVYSEEIVDYKNQDYSGGEIVINNAGNEEVQKVLGSSPVITGIFGLLLADFGIDLLTY